MRDQKTIVCLKYGDKYSSDYVNKLRSMTARHCSYDHQFVCFTDDSSGIDSNITIIPLKTKNDIHGWWYKTFLFDPSHGLNGSLLFIDLDVVIFNSIDGFFDYSPTKFCISRGFCKDNKNGMNSSCFKFDSGTYSHIYEDFMSDKTSIMNRLHGDQDWIQEKINDHTFWPEDWMMSYKWDMVQKDGTLSFKDNTSVAVFHGKPNPHEVETEWVRNNWR
jgi:hypothetical protein